MNSILAFVIGIIIALMVLANGSLSAVYGAYLSLIIIHSIGIMASLVLLISQKEKKKILHQGSIWIYLGGAAGMLTILFNNAAFGKITVTSILALSLLGQTLMSLIIDFFGLFGMKKQPISKTTIIGLMFSVIGIVVMVDFSAVQKVNALLYSICSGFTVVIARTLSAALSERAGPIEGSLVYYFTSLIGAAVCFVFSLLQGSAVSFQWSPSVWIYFGGILGVAMVLLQNIVVPRISSFQMTLVAFLGQIFTGVVIDMLQGANFLDRSFIGGIVISAGMLLSIALEYTGNHPHRFIQEERK